MSDFLNFFVSRHPEKANKHKYVEKCLSLVDQANYSEELENIYDNLGNSDNVLNLSVALALKNLNTFENIHDEIAVELSRLRQEAESSLQEERNAISDKIHHLNEDKQQEERILEGLSRNEPLLRENAARIENLKKRIEDYRNEILELEARLKKLSVADDDLNSPMLEKLNLLKLLQENVDIFGSGDMTVSDKKRAHYVFNSLYPKLVHSARNKTLFEVRNFFAETLIVLRLLKKSTDPGLPNLRHYVRLVDALVASIYEFDKNRENKTLSFIEAQAIFAKPICFPGWVDDFKLCDQKQSVEENLHSSSSLKKQKEIAIYNRNRDRASEEDSKDADCEGCDCDENCIHQDPCCISLHSYVTDLMTVRETLVGYEAGDLAHIQNVMAGERVERTHVSMRETENYTETEETRRREEEHDHQTSERFELQDATQRTIEKDFAADAGITTSSKYGVPGGGDVAVKTKANASYARSTSEARQTAKNFAKDVTKRSLIKIQEETRKLTTQRVLRQITETNVHSFEGGNQHVIGQYYWVNKKSVCQVMNWGRRLMYDFVVPEPSELYKALIRKKQDDSVENIDVPVKPTVKPSDITEENYQDYIVEYMLEGVAPLEESGTKQFSIKLQKDFQPKNGENVKGEVNGDINIPDNYEAFSIEVQGGHEWHGGNSSDATKSYVLAVGSKEFSEDGGSYATPSGSLPGLDGLIPIVFSSWNVNFVNWTVTIKCRLKSHVIDKWKLGIYEKIMAGYKQQLLDYEQKMGEKEGRDPLLKIKGRNPFLNREMEQTQLWQLVVSMISCQHFDQFNAMKHKVQPCGYPQMNLLEAQEEGEFIQFFEQVFEVKQMMYLFYPYFWGKKCSWADKIETDSGDPLFDKFLAAGAARVTIPVRPGMEALALHYEKTGEIWFGGDKKDLFPESPHYLAMHKEFQSRSGNFQEDRPGLLDIDFEFNDENGNPLLDDNGDNLGLDNSIVMVHGTDFWWDWEDNSTQLEGMLDEEAIKDDIDREIIIARNSYRIVDIELYEGVHNGNSFVPTSANQANDEDFIKGMKWIVRLDREVEMPRCPGLQSPSRTNLKYSAGAIYVGAEWENIIPTDLVWLRSQSAASGGGSIGYSNSLPCYPLEL